MVGWNHDSANWQQKNCLVCNKEFTPKSGSHKFCSEQCKGKWQYSSGRVSTESQYKEISGNWVRYCSRLLRSGGKQRKNISREDLLNLLENQNYKCAITGDNLELGVNASLDHIVEKCNGGSCELDNLQWVTKKANNSKPRKFK